MYNTPVCIIGGGPAGLTASLVLSKFGIEHILLERNSKPVEKVCGECYDKRLLNVLNLIEPNLVEQLYSNRIVQNVEKYEFHTTFNKTFEFNLLPNEIRVSTYRPGFDAFLLEKAKESNYLQYINGTTVSNIENKADEIVVSTNKEVNFLNSKIAIVTTGYQALLSKKNNGNKDFIIAHRQYFNQVNLPAASSVIIYFINKPVKGYFCVMQLPNGLCTAEFITLKKHIGNSNLGIQEVFNIIMDTHGSIQQIFKNALLHGKPKGAVLPKSGMAHNNVSANRILYAGSSVSHINPLTGWGVGHAVFEGYHAAMKVVEALEKNDCSAPFLKSYDTFIYKQLELDFKIGRGFDVMMNTFHKTCNIFLSVVASNKQLSKRVAKIITSV